jgi:hypothetical protein
MNALEKGTAPHFARMARMTQRMTRQNQDVRAFDDLINDADGILYQLERTWSTLATFHFTVSKACRERKHDQFSNFRSKSLQQKIRNRTSSSRRDEHNIGGGKHSSRARGRCKLHEQPNDDQPHGNRYSPRLDCFFAIKVTTKSVLNLGSRLTTKLETTLKVASEAPTSFKLACKQSSRCKGQGYNQKCMIADLQS